MNKQHICILTFLVAVSFGFLAYGATIQPPVDPMVEHGPWLAERAWYVATGAMSMVVFLVVYVFLDLKKTVRDLHRHIQGAEEADMTIKQNMWNEMGRLEREKLSIEVHGMLCRYPVSPDPKNMDKG